MKMKIFAAACAALSLLSSAAMAQTDFPTKPIRMVVPFAPGGATDIIGRLLSQHMSETLGQPVVVENVAGASSMIGAQQVASAANDGYTVLFVGANTFATNPHLYRNITYKLEDIAPISMIGKLPMIFAVPPNSPIKSVEDFAKAGKERELRYGTAGLGGTAHLLGEMLGGVLGFTMVPVHYKGASQAALDVAGGQIDLYFEAVAGGLPLHQSGQTRILAVTSDVRLSNAPDIPTFVEAGFPDVVYYSQYALAAPAGTPQPIIEKLNAAVRQALESDTVRKSLHDSATLPNPTTPEEALEALNADFASMGELIERIGIKID